MVIMSQTAKRGAATATLPMELLDFLPCKEDGAVRAVSILLPKIPDGGFSPVRLRAHTTDTSAGWGNLFVGAPLDFIKLVAAIAMTGGHINASLFNGDYLLLWRLDRIPFPLFCFVIACNLL